MSGLNSIYKQQAKKQRRVDAWCSVRQPTVTTFPGSTNPTPVDETSEPTGRMDPEPTFNRIINTGKPGRSSDHMYFKPTAEL